MTQPALYWSTLAQLHDRHPLLGMALLHHRTIRGTPMSFKGRPFQVEQYADFPRIEGADIVKAVQTGQSEMFTIFGLWDTGWRGRIFAYVMPTDRIRDRFVATRINPLLAAVPGYRAKLPGADQADLIAGDSGSLRKKRMGSGLMLFLGAKTDGDFIELTADTFVVDEYDASQAAGEHNLIRVLDRMKESPDPRHFRLGNPELPGGIETLYEKGDARLFHWRCTHCNEWQPIDWLNNVVDRGADGGWMLRDKAARHDRDAPVRPVCLRCGRAFDRDAKGAAWVARQPDRHRRSYRVTRFDVMTEPLRNLWDEWLDAQASSLKLREWWRRNGGRLHMDATNQVSLEQLHAVACLGAMDHVGGDSYRGRQITCGIDVGALFHLTITEPVTTASGHVERRAVHIATCRHKEAVLDYLERYHVNTAVIDQFPETRIAEEIQEKAANFGCTVWLCSFHSQPRSTQARFGMTVDWRAGTVRVDRTQAFDVATELLHVGAFVGEKRLAGQEVGQTIDGARLYPTDAIATQGWLNQMAAPKRVMIDNRIVWDEGKAEDHYRLSDLYDLVAWELDQQAGVMFEL